MSETPQDFENDALEQYLLNHIEKEPEWLHRLYRRANMSLIYGRMVSGHLQGRLLKMLAQLVGAHRVLELGTFVGYSALCLAEGLPEDGFVDTIEVYDELEDFIRKEALSLPHGNKIRLHIGDALEVMDTLQAGYDLIFIDADKRIYDRYYEKGIELLRPGGLIVADNTLWDGHVIDPRYDKDAQTQGVRRFNDLVASDPRVEVVILPIRDGLTLIRKQ
ncbi:MAG: class I SAM-dependent methyltransferase [Prevotella sp.]|nr:class I SAM-dependent methyltransferase [Bacteroides sp.]MCM1366547.1 class I SAM-dependent methyltransferase [Prevotella sp.]MCM1436857.1 class I SAM-dependent methyltransferase [Prevotella sp.]